MTQPSPSNVKQRRTLWRICYVSVMLLSAAAFTPLVIPSGVIEPVVFGMPRTLWAGILVTGLLVLLTYAAARVYPPDTDPEGEPKSKPASAE